MPIYTDNRLLLGDPKLRKLIAMTFRAIVNDYPSLSCSEIDAVAGCATAGIPHATTLADLVEKPLLYVRSSAKSHGTKQLIEGFFQAGDSVLLVEDLVSTGASAVKALEALRSEGLKVPACLAVFSYGFPTSSDAFSQAACPLLSLVNLEMVLEVAEKDQMISDEERALVEDWLKNPFQWAEKNGMIPRQDQ